MKDEDTRREFIRKAAVAALAFPALFPLGSNTAYASDRSEAMSNPAMLDKTFHIIMKRMVETGVAPHYSEIAGELGLNVEEGRKAVHDLFAARIPGWLFPDTSLIVSFAPFNNLPSQYKITVGGQQKWFGQ